MTAAQTPRTISERLLPSVLKGDAETLRLNANGMFLDVAENLEQAAGALADANESKAFYQRRCDALQDLQNRMRDPERTIVCDILANGHLLPDGAAGNRYKVMPDAELAAAKAVIAACHEAIGESKNSDDETLADCIKQIVTEYKAEAAEAKALRNSVISDEHLQAVASEVRLLHLVEQTATIDGMSIRACACLGPLPECLCVKRNKLVSEFLAAIDASRKG